MLNKYVITTITSLFFVLLMFFGVQLFSKNEMEEVLKVGFIYNADTATAYTNNFARTQTELEDYFGDKIKVYAKYNLGEVEANVGDAIEYFVAQGCRLIFAVSYGHGAVTVAKRLEELGEGPDSPLLRNVNLPADYEKLRLELGE